MASSKTIAGHAALSRYNYQLIYLHRNIAESYVWLINKRLKLTKISVFGRFNRHTATHFVVLSLNSLVILQLPLIIKYQNKKKAPKVRMLLKNG